MSKKKTEKIWHEAMADGEAAGILQTLNAIGHLAAKTGMLELQEAQGAVEDGYEEHYKTCVPSNNHE